MRDGLMLKSLLRVMFLEPYGEILQICSLAVLGLLALTLWGVWEQWIK